MAGTGQWGNADTTEPRTKCPGHATGALRDKSVGAQAGRQEGGWKGQIRTLRSTESKFQARELELSSVVFFKPGPRRRNVSSAWQVGERLMKSVEVRSWEAGCSRAPRGCRGGIFIWNVMQELSNWEGAGPAWDGGLLEINKPGCCRTSNDNSCPWRSP